MKKRPTDYPGVFFREARRIGRRGTERVYYITFKRDGKKIEEKVGRQFADDMTPARAAGIRAERIEGKRQSRKEIREEAEKQKEAENARYTIGRLWSEYKMNRAPGKSLDTDEGRYNAYLKDAFESKEPKEIVKLDVDRLRIRLLKEKSPQTAKHVLNLLTWIVNYGVKNHLCEGVSFKIQKPPVNNEKTEDLSPDQLKALLDAIEADENLQVAALMKLALFTGMRRGELFKLKWEHVDFDRGFVTLKDPKGGPDQKIPLNDEARELLKTHPVESEYVFPGEDGAQRVTAQKALRRIRKRAGLPADFRPLHGLRHTYASMLASSGQVDMYTLQKLLTHKSPSMTQRYAHLRDDALKRASNLAGQIIREAAESVREQARQGEKVIRLKKTKRKAEV